MDISELKKKKRMLGLTNERVSQLSGVPLSTVQKVFAGATRSPREDTLLRIERAIIKYEIDRKNAAYSLRPDDSSWIRETNLLDLYDEYFGTLSYPFEDVPDDVITPHKEHGEYTLQDFYAMPPDRHVELIDGVIYDMAEPTNVHQLLIGAIFLELSLQIQSNGMDCLTIMSPVGVRLSMDNRTMVEPDIIVVCGHDNGDIEDAEEEHPEDMLNDNSVPLARLASRFFDGAPDFVIEILSPSNKEYDMGVKYHKYMKSGVREYWMVDPERGRVIVTLRDETVVKLYTFKVI